jgi:chemotaxis protein CheX
MTAPATATTDAKSNALDVRLVNPIVSATMEVLGTMANMQVKLKATKAEKDFLPSGDISAVIGILGEEGEGMVSLSFPMAMASQIVANLLGLSPADLSAEDRADGVGEVVNMVSGNAKAALSRESGGTYKLSLPTIIVGGNHEVISRPKSTPSLIMEFEAEDGSCFQLQLNYRKN